MKSSILLALATSLLWAIPPIAQKYLVLKSSPEAVLVIGAFVYAIAASIFGLFHIQKLKDASSLLFDMRIVLLLLFSVIIGAFLGNIIFLKVLRDHASHIVIALAYTSPIFVLMWMLLTKSAKIGWRSVAGVIAVVVGASLLITEDKYIPQK